MPKFNDLEKSLYNQLEKTAYNEISEDFQPQVVEDGIVKPGGVLVKLEVTLDKAQPVSEISLVPFTQYPMEVVSIMYEEDVETFHPKKELPLLGNTKSTESMTFKFPEVFAKRFTIILRQPNYVKDTYLVKETDLNKKVLWEKISRREAEVTLDLSDGRETISNVNGLTEVDTYTGWNIYLQELVKHEKHIRKLKEDAKKHRKVMKPKPKNDGKLRIQLPEFRRDFREAVQRYLNWFKQSESKEDGSNKGNVLLHNTRLRDWFERIKERF